MRLRGRELLLTIILLTAVAGAQAARKHDASKSDAGQSDAAATDASAAATNSTGPARAKASRGAELDRVVAVVNDGVVLESELNAQTTEFTQRLTAQKVALPPMGVLREQVLERLVL
jgi:hypothetical protein